VAYLSKHLEPEFETLLISGKRDRDEASSAGFIKEMGLRPHYVPQMRRAISPLRDRIAFRRLRKIIREFKPDIVHTHAAKAGAIGRYAAIKERVPVIVHTFHGHVFHSYFNRARTNIFLNIERYLAKRTDCVIAVSNLQKRELTEEHRVCGPDKVEVIPLGLDLTPFMTDVAIKRRSFRERFHVADDEVAVGIIGRIVPIKNHELFIRALANVFPRTSKSVRAFVIGDGEDRHHIEKLATSLNIAITNGHGTAGPKSLTFTSWMKEIDQATAGLDVIALTSLNEGTPVSLIEAQAANKPIVSTRVGGIEDVVIEGETALLSAVDDQQGFADNLLKAIEGNGLNGHIHRGADFVAQRFSYTRLVEETRELYWKLLRAKGWAD
jgi:glycosyltransferase involved in cell wall biosynthesis